MTSTRFPKARLCFRTSRWCVCKVRSSNASSWRVFILNVMNFQTLIATKAARICQAARNEPVLEFGLRRAQGVDGALAASRAAYVGGCEGTSNVLAGKLFGIPVRGTHAHSWVMSFDEELEAFLAFARAMPNNCILLVDTYDTLEGVRKAVEVGKRLREQGHKLAGIRLDSGDLAYLSIEARKILDAGGLHDAVIVASNDLDEHIITSLKDQGAQIILLGSRHTLGDRARPTRSGWRVQTNSSAACSRSVGVQTEAVGADAEDLNSRDSSGETLFFR